MVSFLLTHKGGFSYQNSLFHRTCQDYHLDALNHSSLTEDLVSRYREITNGAEPVTIIFLSCSPPSGSQKGLRRDFP
jgi:hypothetical protein